MAQHRATPIRCAINCASHEEGQRVATVMRDLGPHGDGLTEVRDTVRQWCVVVACPESAEREQNSVVVALLGGSGADHSTETHTAEASAARSVK